MSAIIDHAVFDTQAPTGRPATGIGKCARQAEFRATLDNYMEDYRKLRAQHDFLELCKRPDLAAEITVTPVERLGVAIELSALAER